MCLTKLGGAFLVMSLVLEAAYAAEAPVAVREESMTIPTYLLGAPDKNPVFVERRAYQGAEAPIYPYAMLDAMTDRRADKTYKAIILENRYVRICVLPEIGGRVFAACDKTNGYDFIYRQHVIKPALIGMVGAWISGGIEWNIPHHHRASTFMPVDYSYTQDPDGSAVVRVGELELRHRMRWVVELRLRPDSSCVEQTVRLINRTAVANSFLFFANIAVAANRDYQVLFPTDVQWVTNHGKREFFEWPQAKSIYNGIDFRRGVDASWWRNHPSPISMFVWGSKMDFVGGYDHGRQAGMIHVADHHISPGKKFFTWGAGEAGQMWDRVLTDADGPYIELMAGSYSDNQPDYSWIGPYQTKVAETFWYPFTKIGGAKYANREAAVNLDVDSHATARFGVAVTRVHPKLRVILANAAGAIFDKQVEADPGRPFVGQCPLPAKTEKLTLRVLAGDRELISYTPVDRPATPRPEAIRPPARPEIIDGVEAVYQAGLRLEQLHSAALDPDDYYREVLRRDPGHVKANTALGIRAWQRHELAAAEKHLETAAHRATGLYLAPKDGEPHYYLGLVQRALHKDQAACDSFAQAAWVAGWESPANQQLAEMCCATSDFSQTLVHLDRALEANAENVKALTLKAVVLRQLDRRAEATPLLARAVAVDPLDPWPKCEQAMGSAHVPAQVLTDPQARLEAAADYMAGALWPEAIAVLKASSQDSSVAKAAVQPSSAAKAAVQPMVQYFLAYCLEQAGQATPADACYAVAAAASPDHVFPFRREAFDVLHHARKHNPNDPHAAYYLGNLYRMHGHFAAAIAQWEDARRLAPAYAIVHRNLALAYASQPQGQTKALASMKKAIELAPHEPRFCLEMDQLNEAAGVPAQERLAFLEQRQAVVSKRDDALAREIALLVDLGQALKALQLLQGHTFHVWEGAGRTAVHNSYAKAHLLLGQEQAKAGRHREAIQEFEAALQYPVNLGSGRPLRGERLPETYYDLAETYAALGDQQAAQSHYQKAVETAPADLTAPSILVVGDPECHAFAAKALQKLERNAQAADVSKCLIASGEAALADHLPMYFFASFGHPQPDHVRFAQAHYAIGLGLLGLGKTAAAQAAFQKAVDLNPHHTAAREQLQTLK